jgi:hypothetical protein
VTGRRRYAAGFFHPSRTSDDPIVGKRCLRMTSRALVKTIGFGIAGSGHGGQPDGGGEGRQAIDLQHDQRRGVVRPLTGRRRIALPWRRCHVRASIDQPLPRAGSACAALISAIRRLAGQRGLDKTIATVAHSEESEERQPYADADHRGAA